MLGQSFLPGGDDPQMRQDQGAGPVNPVQEAIRVLTLRMPRFLQGAPAPPQLLMGSGAAGMPGENPLSQILQQMFMPGAQPAASGGKPPASQGKPRTEFIPDPNSGTAAGPDASAQGGRVPTEAGQRDRGWAVDRDQLPAKDRPGGTVPPFGGGGRRPPTY